MTFCIGQQSSDSPYTLTNERIIQAVKTGMPEDDIINMVNTVKGKYFFWPEDIAALKAAGVSDKVIAAMRSHPDILYVPGPNDPTIPTVAVPPPPPRSPMPTHQVALVFDDAAYHRCSARENLIKNMTPEQKAAFKDEQPCPEENDRAYHTCLEDYTASACTVMANDPDYVRSHQRGTITIEKVRKVYVDKFLGAGWIKKTIRNGTCLEVVDSAAQADAILKKVNSVVRREYSPDDAGNDVTCGSSPYGASCTDGVTTTYTNCDGSGNCTSGTYHITDITTTLSLEDPHTGKAVKGWHEDTSLDRLKNFASSLGEAVGCGRIPHE